MLDIEHIDHISDEMRAVVESEWPEPAPQAAAEGVALNAAFVRAGRSVRNLSARP